MKKHIQQRLLIGAFMGICAFFSHAHDAQAVSPRQLLETVDIGSLTMSPDGRSVAFRVEQASVERNTYDTIWYVQDLDEASPRRVADGGVPLRDSAGVVLPAITIWSADGHWIYYRALADGRIDVWRAAADGSGSSPVTLDAADVRDFSLVKNSRALRYSVGPTREAVLSAEQAEYDQGIRIDESVPIGQSLFRSGNIEGRMATQRFGKVWFDRAALLADVPDRWYEIDLATGVKQEVAASVVSSELPAEPPRKHVKGDPWKSVREPRGDRIAVLTRAGDGNGRLQRTDVLLSVLPDVHCVAAQCTDKNITGIQWRPGHDEVLFTVTDTDQGVAQSIHRWNVESGEMNAVIKSMGLASGGRDPSSNCGVSSESLVCVTANVEHPPRLEKISLESGERRVLFDPNRVLAQDLARNSSTRLLRWVDAKGRRYTGQFYPARRGDHRPVPLFVTYYVCSGFVRGGVGDEWPLASLAQTGISALCINQLPEFAMDAIERHGQGLAAVESVVGLLSAEGEIDRERVGMGGLSFGGAVTLWTVTESDLLAAASVANPVVSPVYYLLGSMKGERFLEGLRNMWGLGAPGETPERWRDLSPAFKLDRIRAPILFQHSEQEYIYALDYLIPLLRQGMAELYVFPNEPHQKFQPKHKLAVYERNLDWFRFWLQGYEDAIPTKQTQYARWREMKKGLQARTP